MTRVRILRDTKGAHGAALATGELYELPDGFAQQLIDRGRAVAVLGLPEGGAPVPESRDPAPAHADPAPARSRRR